MRYGDIQDTRNPEVIKEQRKEKYRRIFEWRMEKLSSMYNDRRRIAIFGVVFTF